MKFLTDWSPESGQPQPQELSRHITVHHATIAHLHDENGLIAVMLATGLIRALSEMYEWFAARRNKTRVKKASKSGSKSPRQR